MQSISPFLWFDDKAEEAANFYVDTFNGLAGASWGMSEVHDVSRYDEAGAKASGRKAGSVMVVNFSLGGLDFSAINGGPMFKFSGAISFVVSCKNQKEVDYLWDKLSADGGETGQCGWINHDKFGVTWQIVPVQLIKLMGDPDPEKSGRVMKAMLKMTKIDIAQLETAYKGK